MAPHALSAAEAQSPAHIDSPTTEQQLQSLYGQSVLPTNSSHGPPGGRAQVVEDVHFIKQTLAHTVHKKKQSYFPTDRAGVLALIEEHVPLVR